MAKYLQMRLTEEDEAILKELTSEYQLDRSNLVRFALSYIREHKPTFTVVHAPESRRDENTRSGSSD